MEAINSISGRGRSMSSLVEQILYNFDMFISMIQWDLSHVIWEQKWIFLVGGLLPGAIRFVFREGTEEVLPFPIVCYPFVVMLNIFFTAEDELQGITVRVFGLIASVLNARILPNHVTTMNWMKQTICFWSIIIANGLTLLAMALLDVRAASEERAVGKSKYAPRLLNLVLNLSLLMPLPSGRSRLEGASSYSTAFKLFSTTVIMLLSILPWHIRTGKNRLKPFSVLNIMFFICSCFMFDTRELPTRLLINCLSAVVAFIFLSLLSWSISLNGLRDTWKRIKQRIERIINRWKHGNFAEKVPVASFSTSAAQNQLRISNQVRAVELDFKPDEKEQSRPSWVSSQGKPNEITLLEDSDEEDQISKKSNLFSSVRERLRNDSLRTHHPLTRPSLISQPMQFNVVPADVGKTTTKRYHKKMMSGTHETATVSSSVSSRGIDVDKVENDDISRGSESVLVNLPSGEEGYMRHCLLYCSLFTADYEFTKDALVWSWIAAGTMEGEKNDDMEGVAIRCFDELIQGKHIVQSGYDRLSDQMRYKLGDRKDISLRQQHSELQYRRNLVSDTNLDELEHLSLIYEGIDQHHSELLSKCKNLKTLLMHKCNGYKLAYILNDLFMKLEFLTSLDLSCTDIVELPSSVENLKELKYLDMSHTLIRRLPESIDSLVNLETLLLLGCRNLFGLPIGMSKLKKLQHLALDITRQLESTIIGIGNLTNLQTLGTFPIGTKEGRRIGELENMRKLKGSLCISKLEKILNKEEAQKAMICDKPHLTKLQLLWSDLQDAKVSNEEEILENLQPHFAIQELEIYYYSGGVLPSWISNPSFTKITSITLLWCRYCEKLPCLGDLPSLKYLSIVEMDGVVEIDNFFSRKKCNKDQCAFPQLEKLSFEGMSNLKSWTAIDNGDFPRLLHLSITYCPKLVSLPSLSHLNSLQHLEIRVCPELPCFPEGGLPSSVKSLIVKDCPKWN